MKSNCLLLLSLVAIACAQPARTVAAPDCIAGWKARFNGDSSVALCAPAGFRLAPASVAGEPSFRWARPHPATPVGEWLSIRVERREAYDSLDPWPLRLESPTPCRADCSTADSAHTHRDTVAGAVAFVETGLESGGFAGLRRHPTLVASWEPAAGYRAHAWGSAQSGAMLDTLRQMLRSARLRVAISAMPHAIRASAARSPR